MLVTVIAATSCSRVPTPESALPSGCESGPAIDSVAPSREGFLREVLFSPPTARTPRYDDYTPGSYHIDKLDLARGLAEEASRCGVAPRALIVLGPMGPLWSYHVVAFLRDTGAYQVTSLVMPHARITGKGVGRLQHAPVDAILDSLVRSTVVRHGAPSWPDTAASIGRDFSYDFLMASYGPDSIALWHAELRERTSADEAKEAERVIAMLNRILSQTKTTYPLKSPSAPR